LGVKSLKVSTQWDLLEPENDSFYFDDLDWQLVKAKEREAKILLVIGMKTGRWPECHIPNWAKGFNKTEQQKEILGLLEKIVLRYQDSSSVSSWQVENEPFFPFGECPWVDKNFLKKEINMVKSLDFQKRPVVVSDSGEGSLWIQAARYGDIVGTTLYKNVWFRQIGRYVSYPFPPAFYWRKAKYIEKLFNKKVMVVELQAEPWGPRLLYDSPLEEQKKTMNLEQFRKNIDFAKRTGFDTLYLWGGEWWYWLKERQGQPEIWQEAKKLFSPRTAADFDKLTLEQKIGQLFLIGFEGKTLTPGLESLLKTVRPGGVLLLSRNIENESQLKKLIKDLQKISLENSGFPLFIAIDQEGKPLSRIKWLSEQTSQSKIRSREEAYQVGFNRGKELKNLGINLNLAPVLDITGAADFLYNRSFQKSPEETGILAKALISGQKTAGIFTAIKHFPGYGGISFNPEREGLPTLLKIPEISQFKTSLEAKPEMIMTSNVIYQEIDAEFPLALSQKGIQFLKDGLGNDFLVISDDFSSPVLKNEFSLKNTVISAAKAGVNVLTVAGFDEPRDPLRAFNFLLEAKKNNEISEEKINQSVSKIIKLKIDLCCQ
jgi:beta-N-acetylhexosaminidase